MWLFDPGIKLIQALSGSYSERNIILQRAKLSIVITRFSIQYAASIDYITEFVSSTDIIRVFYDLYCFFS